MQWRTGRGKLAVKIIKINFCYEFPEPKLKVKMVYINHATDKSSVPATFPIFT